MANIVNGWVDDDLSALVEVELTNGARFVCEVDTGFHGSLMLPVAWVQDAQLQLAGQEFWKGADGREFKSETAVAEVSWLGDEFLAEIVVSDAGFALLGNEMLIDAALHIDYAGRTVTIEKFY